jgi:hypothetical protein
MKLFLLALTCILLPVLPLAAQSDDWIGLLEKDAQGNFTTSGWSQHGNGSFLIDPATGVLTSSGGSGVFWYGKRKFADFELELEYMCDSLNTNSGVFLRIPSPPDGDDYIHNSFEIQILGRDTDDMLHANGAIYDASPATRHAAKGPGEWNKFNIICRGMRYTVVLNGETVADWDIQPAGKITSVASEGYVGMQNYFRGGAVHFRNLRVRELDGN